MVRRFSRPVNPGICSFRLVGRRRYPALGTHEPAAADRGAKTEETAPNGESIAAVPRERIWPPKAQPRKPFGKEALDQLADAEEIARLDAIGDAIERASR